MIGSPLRSTPTPLGAEDSKAVRDLVLFARLRRHVLTADFLKFKQTDNGILFIPEREAFSWSSFQGVSDAMMNRGKKSVFLIVSAVVLVALAGSFSQGTPITYDTCLQDDSSGYSMQVNTTTGDYKFKRCDTGLTVTGLGTLTVQGSTYSLQDNPSDRRVVANWTAGGAGTASLQLPPGTTVITISDHDITNNNCGS